MDSDEHLTLEQSRAARVARNEAYLERLGLNNKNPLQLEQEEAKKKLSITRYNNSLIKANMAQGHVRTRSYKTLSEKRQMGSEEEAKKKEEKDEIPYRDIDGCLQCIAMRPCMSPENIHKLIIKTDDDLTDDDLDSTKRYKQFEGHYCTGEEAVITASSNNKLFVINPEHIAKKPVNLRTKDSKGKTKAIKIFVDCFPLLATHGWAGGVGKTPPQVMEMAKDFKTLKRLESPFHNQGDAGHVGDSPEIAKMRKSLEGGFSTYPGGRPIQRKAKKDDVPYLLASLKDESGIAFFTKYKGLLTCAWKICENFDPEMCSKMKNAVSEEFQLYGTGFTKATFAIDNPTPTHKDFNNFGLTFLIAWDVSGDGEELIGGSHVVTDPVFGKAVVIKDSKGGVVIIGDYRVIVHANLAVLKGHRMIVSAYCSQGVVDCCRRKKEKTKNDQLNKGKDKEDNDEVQEEDVKREKRNIVEAYREVTSEDIGKWSVKKCKLQCKAWNLQSMRGSSKELKNKLRRKLRDWGEKQEEVPKSVN